MPARLEGAGVLEAESESWKLFPRLYRAATGSPSRQANLQHRTPGTGRALHANVAFIAPPTPEQLATECTGRCSPVGGGELATARSPVAYWDAGDAGEAPRPTTAMKAFGGR